MLTYVKLSFMFLFISSPNKFCPIFSVHNGTILGASMSFVIIVLGFFYLSLVFNVEEPPFSLKQFCERVGVALTFAKLLKRLFLIRDGVCQKDRFVGVAPQSHLFIPPVVRIIY